MSLPVGIIRLEIDAGPVVANGAKVEDTLRRIQNQGEETGKKMEMSTRRAALTTFGFASSLGSLKFQADNLDDSLLKVRKTTLEVSRAQEEVNKLEKEGKTNTLDYAQAKERLAIAEERLSQNTKDASNAQYAFGFSIVGTALQIPNAINAIKNLTASTTILNAVTSKWTLIALGVIGAFEGIAHIIKIINPEIDITIESFAGRLTKAFGSATAGAEEYTGVMKDVTGAHKTAKQETDHFSGSILNLTSYWGNQNEKIAENIRLLREQTQAQKIAVTNAEELKKKLKTKGTLWDAIIDFLFKPNLFPSASAEEAVDFAERVNGANLGTLPGSTFRKATQFTPQNQVIINRMFNDLPTNFSANGDPVMNWAEMVWRATFAPDTLGQIGQFPKPPFSIQDMWAEALRNAGVNRLSVVKSEFQKQMDNEAKKLLNTLRSDQAIIKKQRDISKLLALKELNNFREQTIIEFVGQDVYERLLVRALLDGHNVDDAKEIAKQGLLNTSRGLIEVLPNGNIRIQNNGSKSALGGTFFGAAGISGIGNLFGRNDLSLSEMTGNMSLTLQNLGFGALSSYTKSYGIGGTANILGRRQASIGVTHAPAGLRSGLTTAKGRSSKHGGFKRGWGVQEVIRPFNEASVGLQSVADELALFGFNIAIPSFGLESLVRGYKSPSNEFLQTSIRQAKDRYNAQMLQQLEPR